MDVGVLARRLPCCGAGFGVSAPGRAAGEGRLSVGASGRENRAASFAAVGLRVSPSGAAVRMDSLKESRLIATGEVRLSQGNDLKISPTPAKSRIPALSSHSPSLHLGVSRQVEHVIILLLIVSEKSASPRGRVIPRLSKQPDGASEPPRRSSEGFSSEPANRAGSVSPPRARRSPTRPICPRARDLNPT